MAYLLVALTVYQFTFRALRLQGSPLFIILNPYFLALPFIVFWLGSAIVGGHRTDRNLLLAWIAVLIFPCVMLRDFNGDAGFFFIFLRGMQFFWGPLLIVPAFLGFFRMLGFLDTSETLPRTYITWMAAITGSLTLFELLAVKILGIPPLTFPWIGSPDTMISQDIDPFRPWGLPSYPQPNALIMAYLFWLASVWGTKGLYHKLVTFFGVVFSGSGTGQLGFAAMSALVARRPLAAVTIIVVPVVLLVTWASLTHQFTTGALGTFSPILGRLDVEYTLNRFIPLFVTVASRFLSRFTTEELLFGTSTPNNDVATGFTHDWGYLDVFYAYGTVGVAGYVLVFGAILFLALPPHLATGRRLFFAVLGLALNFHYGTLNFYAGQMLFSSIVVLRLNRTYSQEVEKGRIAAG